MAKGRDGRFHDLASKSHGGLQFLKWRATRDVGPWPERVEVTPGPPPPDRVDGGEIRATFVSHATVLLQSGGVNVLTDPVFSERVGPFPWLGVRRRAAPGIRFEELPPIHLVLVSHDHYDHLDLPTLRRLHEEFRPLVVTGLGNGRFLAGEGIPGAVELDWWQTADAGGRGVVPGALAGFSVTAVPAEHFSGRGAFDRDRSLWCGFVVEGPAGAFYFAGDTGWGPHFAAVGRKFPGLRLALLPIGAFRPRWFMSPVHMDPDDAVRAHLALGADRSLAIHWGAFPLADDGLEEPVDELRKALARHRVASPSFAVLRNGESLGPDRFERSLE